jgi:hypothetical protein
MEMVRSHTRKPQMSITIRPCHGIIKGRDEEEDPKTRGYRDKENRYVMEGFREDNPG